MSRFQLLWFRVRAGFVNLVVAAGVLVIIYLQWPQAVQANCFAVSGCSQGWVGTILLALIMAGIPAILFAVVAHVGLSWLLFKSGELDEYKARKVIASMDKGHAAVRSDNAESSSHIFED